MEKLIESIESSLEASSWYAALIAAITLPDIAGKIEYPTSHTRYGNWFDTYVGREYEGFLAGTDCYALRCSLLHEGVSRISHQRAQEVLDDFQFIIPPENGMMHCNLIAKIDSNGAIQGAVLQLQVDIFCRDLVSGIRAWLIDIKGDSDKLEALRNMLSVRAFADLTLET